MNLLHLCWSSCINGVPAFLSVSLSVKAEEVCGCSILKTGLQISLFLHGWIIVLLTPNLEPKSSQYYHELILIHKLTSKLDSFWQYLYTAFPLLMKYKNNCSISLHRVNRSGETWYDCSAWKYIHYFCGANQQQNLNWSFSIIHSVLNPYSYPSLNIRDAK